MPKMSLTGDLKHDMHTHDDSGSDMGWIPPGHVKNGGTNIHSLGDQQFVPWGYKISFHGGKKICSMGEQILGEKFSLIPDIAASHFISIATFIYKY